MEKSRPGSTADSAVQLLGSQTLAVTGQVYQLVTFLNRCLRDRHLEFGLRRQSDGQYLLSVYQVQDPIGLPSQVLSAAARSPAQVGQGKGRNLE